MRSKTAILLAAVCSLVAPGLVLAHHSLNAQFDTQKTITLAGTVERIDWSNPHVRLYIDVKNQDVKDESNRATWEVDMGSPNLQMMNGWKIDTYRRGDPVIIVAFPARDGSKVSYGRKVTRVAVLPK